MTTTEYLDEIKRILRDQGEAADRRWPDSVLINYSVHYMEYLWDSHPEAFMYDAIVTSMPTFTISSDSVPVSNSFITPMIDYVAAQCLAEDGQDAANLNVANWRLGKAGSEE